MQSHHIEITKTARYFTYGQLSGKTKNVWFACHGYGQLAEYFIRKFDGLNPEENYVICPEALSKFYSNGFSGRVGATWMTKEDRLTEIKDYIAYLNALYQKIFEHESLSKNQVNIKILGFSQGTATVSRWVFDEKVTFDELIIWAGGLAHDLDFEKTQRVFQHKKLYLVYGKQDELIKPEHFTQQEELMQKHALVPKIITFEGKHELNKEIITQLSLGE